MEKTMDFMDDAAAQSGTVVDVEGKYLTFFCDNQHFGIPIADVVQIIGIQEITKIPEFPAYAKGVINLRGSVVPIVDVRLRFGKPEKDYDERTCIIVTYIHDNAIGFLVDAVDAVTNIDDSAISEPPKMAGQHADSYLTGIANLEGRVVLLMDTRRLLSDDAVADLVAVPAE